MLSAVTRVDTSVHVVHVVHVDVQPSILVAILAAIVLLIAIVFWMRRSRRK